MAQKTAHCAPDFDQRVNFNTVRVKPEYRIELRMGNIEDLFKNAANTKDGRMERLQVLGLFYFQLKHSKAQDRFDETWKWFKDKIAKVADDAAADKVIQSALKCRVVSGATPPAWTDAPSGLPTDAADPMNPAAENFAKIRLPGTFALQWNAGRRSINKDTSYPGAFGTHRQFQQEAKFYEDNVVLGKIPLVAKVEKRLDEDSPWEPAKDASVHFQLLPVYPYDKPAYDSGVKSSNQFQRPPLGAIRSIRHSNPLQNPPPNPLPPHWPMASTAGGPKKKVEAEEAHSPTGDASITGADRFKPENAHKIDPQGINAHKSRGGKRGEGSLTDCSDVAGHVFSTTAMDGFNQDGPRKPGHKPYPVAEKAKADAHKHVHAVRAKTNEDGEAGVIFTPSRMSGDRYRLRAYIGPPTTASHGAEVGATQVTTGTFVIWRNLRISRLLKQDCNANPDDKLMKEAQAKPYQLADSHAYMQGVGLSDGTNFLGLSNVRLDDPDGGNGIFSSLPLHWAPAFLEVEYDQAGFETLTAAEYKTARKQGADDAKAGQADLGLSLDVDALYWMDQDFDPSATVAVAVMRSPETYNKKVSSSKRLPFTNKVLNADVKTNVESLTEMYYLNGFLRHLTKNGALPGLTLLYSGIGYTWQLILGGAYSGIALDYRGAYLWAGQGWYDAWPNGVNFAYDCSCNANHELGHVMFQPHGVAGAAGGPNANRHDPEADHICVMSYGRCQGMYCGLTLLAFRGWDVPQPSA